MKKPGKSSGNFWTDIYAVSSSFFLRLLHTFSDRGVLGVAIAAHCLVLLDPRRLVGQCKYLPF